MDIRDRRGLKEAASSALIDAPYSPKKLVMIHTAVSLALSLVILVMNLVLDNQISSTGGLGGLGARTALETAQSVLQLVQTVALPFWELGLIFAAIRISRRMTAEPASLLEGFRRFWPAMRLKLILAAIYTAVGFVSLSFCCQIIVMTPLAEPLLEVLEPIAAQMDVMNTAPVIDAETRAALMDAYIPIFAFFGLLYGCLLMVLNYRFRLAEYLIMDGKTLRAIDALKLSAVMTRGSRMNLFALDLSFWWFYAAQLLLAVVCYGDVILGSLGIALPVSGMAAEIGAYVLYIAGQLILFTLVRGKVEVTYAMAYDSLEEQFCRKFLSGQMPPAQA